MPIPAGYHETLAPPSAARSVEAVWSFVATTRGTTLVLPDGRCDVIARYGASGAVTPVLTGPATAPYRVEYQRGDTWVGLRLRPDHGARLWGNGLATAANRVLRGNDALAALPALAPICAVSANIGHITACLLRLDLGASKAPAEVSRGIDALHLSGGRLLLPDLARLMGCTPRHAARLFGLWVGLPPKTYARLVQFQRAVAMLRRGGIGLTDAALEAGFADHSHMTRSLQRFGGFAPSRLPDDLAQPGFFAT